MPIDDLREAYPELAFAGLTELELPDGTVLVTDPIYLADVYNARGDPTASFIRSHGVIVSDFGGDTSCPVWWDGSFLVLPGRYRFCYEQHGDESVTYPGWYRNIVAVRQ